MICRRLLREGALESEAVGGQVCTEASDSSDSVIKGVERCLFSRFIAAVAFVADYRLGLVGGSAITIDVDGISIGGREIACYFYAVITVRLGFVGIRTLSARVTFECIEETAVTSSAIFRCFMRLPPPSFFLASFA